MKTSLCRRRNQFAFVACIALCLLCSQAYSGEVAWRLPRFQYVAHNKSLREMLRDFSVLQGVQVQIAEGIEGQVSGSFDLEPKAMLDALAADYGFEWRFDGALLNILPAADGRTVRLRAATLDDLRATLDRLDQHSTVSMPGKDDDRAPESSNGNWQLFVADKTLNTALARWAASAGWQLLWEPSVDYPIDVQTSLRGTFEEAVEAVARALQTADAPIKAIFYRGNKVLRIVAVKGER